MQIDRCGVKKARTWKLTFKKEPLFPRGEMMWMCGEGMGKMEDE